MVISYSFIMHKGIATGGCAAFAMTGRKHSPCNDKVSFLIDKPLRLIQSKEKVMQKRQTQSAEDYLETILLLADGQDAVHRVDVAKQMGVSGAAVNKAMKILLEKGLLYESGKHLFLTEEGKTLAQTVFEKHCAIRDFLLSLGVSPDVAEEDACKMEHVVSNQTVEAMKNVVKK